MAEHWMKALGSRLLSTGAAYLQQVRLVQELQGLSPAQARERFAGYVAGLSTQARAGFALTLAALANGEANPRVRQFIQSLRDGLADPASWTATPAVDAPAPAGAADTGDAGMAGDDFEAALARLDAWYQLDDPALRAEAATLHLATLDHAALGRLLGHLERMQRNAAQALHDHDEDEARFAAGRFIEDQQHYRLMRIAGAPPDPAWLAQREALRAGSDWIDTVHGLAVAAQAARRAPPATAAAAPVVDPAAAPAGAAAAPGERRDGNELQGLREMLESELAAGRIPAERRHTYARMLDKIGSLVPGPDGQALPPAVAHQRMQELARDFLPQLADPGALSARAAPAARRVLEHAGAIKAALTQALLAVPPAATAGAIAAIVGDVTRVQTEAGAADDEPALAALEASLLRPAARAWHELVLTRHATLARPLWECRAPMAQVNTLFFSGQADLGEQLARVAAAKRLTVDDTQRLQHHGQARWDLLQACHVAVFDLRGAGALAQLAQDNPRRARQLTASAYELGLAFALGKPVVVAAAAGERLPFDIDLAALPLEGDGGDDALIAQALDEAFYLPQRPATTESIGASLAWLDRATASHPRRAAFEHQGWLDAGLVRDPVTFVAGSAQILATLGAPPWQLLRPSWAGAYPASATDAAAAPRCFHVMPFGPPWADGVRDAARAACNARGWVYRRGDEAEEGRIIHAIWDDLCRADLVLVELCGGNLNVLIELGMAHALGRPVLAVQRRGEVDLRPRHIEKLRVLAYDDAAGLRQLLDARLAA